MLYQEFNKNLFYNINLRSDTYGREIDLFNHLEDWKRMELQEMYNKKNWPSLKTINSNWPSNMHASNKITVEPSDKYEIADLEEQVTKLSRHNRSLCNSIWTINEISINGLRNFGFDDIADRLTSLHHDAMEEDLLLVPASLQNFILFIVNQPRLSTPEIGINPYGRVQTVWKVPDYGSLAMDFLESGDIEFSILHYPLDVENKKDRGGISHISNIMQGIGEFADKLYNG